MDLSLSNHTHSFTGAYSKSLNTSHNHFKPEDKILFICTRQCFLDSHRAALLEICSQHEINWQAVYQTADLHGVAPLVYANLQQCQPQRLDIPSDILNQFKQSLMRNMFMKEKLRRNLTRALFFFAEKSIDVMLIKGGALDVLVYNQPYATVINDIDLIINLKREETTAAEMREFMAFFHQSGVEYDYFEHHDVSINGVLPVNFHRIWSDATKIEVKEYNLLVMSPEDMLISVCINSCRKRFFRLKALCDIAEIVNRFRPLNWSKLVEKTRAYDCHNIVYTALLVTKMTLGCDLPDEVLDNLKVNRIRASMIHYLSQQMSLSSFSSLYYGKDLLGRKIGWSLLLPYATFRLYQVWRRIAFLYLSALQNRSGLS